MATTPINSMHPPSILRSRGGLVDRVAPALPDQVGASPEQPVAKVDKVDLTYSLNLRQMEMPFDQERIAALRKAIASGEYQPNSARIASKMLNFETKLFA